jgi:hypothetical protein
MRDAAAYREFLSDFLARKIEMFGQVAQTRAQAVSGLELDARGRVVGFGADPLATVEAVLKTFERLTGKASHLTVQASLRALRILERYPGLELPGGPAAAADASRASDPRPGRG